MGEYAIRRMLLFIPTLLVATDPATGLTGTHVARLAAWAASLRD